MARIALTTRLQKAITPKALRSYLAEFISTFFFVFTVVGSMMSSRKLMPDAASDPASLVMELNHVPTYGITEEMTGFGASVLEGVRTFGLVYTVYIAGDPRHGAFGGIGPLAVGFMAGASVLATGPFSGGSMNPACAFGAVYRVGPLIGAAVAGLLYVNVVYPTQSPDSLTGISTGFSSINVS